MKVIIEHTRFVNNQTIDLNYILLSKYRKVLCIATREGQIARINKWIKKQPTDILGEITILGWWDLRDAGYLSNSSVWTQYDCIIFLDPNRCAFKADYETLITNIKQ